LDISSQTAEAKISGMTFMLISEEGTIEMSIKIITGHMFSHLLKQEEHFLLAIIHAILSAGSTYQPYSVYCGHTVFG
jgi:hypothetical protein